MSVKQIFVHMQLLTVLLCCDTVLLQMYGKFDAQDCECMWKNVLRPGINRKKWSTEEEEKLESLVLKYNMRHWNNIASELDVRTHYRIILSCISLTSYQFVSGFRQDICCKG